MENNINNEIISQLAVKIANLEVQVAALSAENKVLYSQLQQPSSEENVEGVEVDEPSE